MITDRLLYLWSLLMRPRVLMSKLYLVSCQLLVMRIYLRYVLIHHLFLLLVHRVNHQSWWSLFKSMYLLPLREHYLLERILILLSILLRLNVLWSWMPGIHQLILHLTLHKGYLSLIKGHWRPHLLILAYPYVKSWNLCSMCWMKWACAFRRLVNSRMKCLERFIWLSEWIVWLNSWKIVLLWNSSCDLIKRSEGSLIFVVNISFPHESHGCLFCETRRHIPLRFIHVERRGLMHESRLLYFIIFGYLWHSFIFFFSESTIKEELVIFKKFRCFCPFSFFAALTWAIIIAIISFLNAFKLPSDHYFVKFRSLEQYLHDFRFGQGSFIITA